MKFKKIALASFALVSAVALAACSTNSSSKKEDEALKTKKVLKLG